MIEYFLALENNVQRDEGYVRQSLERELQPFSPEDRQMIMGVKDIMSPPWYDGKGKGNVTGNATRKTPPPSQ